jgi:predicted Zn-dependent protease
LVADASVAGYSRSKEMEADQLATERTTSAGYATDATAQLFARMDRESKARDQREVPYLFASHPRSDDRAAAAARQAVAPAGMARRAEYLAATAKVRADALDDMREQGKATALTFLLADEGMAADIPPSGYFMLGEGYRMRQRDGDIERAIEQYQKSIDEYPQYGPAWGALGRIYARHQRPAEAIEYLSRYLQLVPEAPDAAFVQQDIDRLRGKVHP